MNDHLEDVKKRTAEDWSIANAVFAQAVALERIAASLEKIVNALDAAENRHEYQDVRNIFVGPS